MLYFPSLFFANVSAQYDVVEMSGWLDLKCTVIKGGMKILPAIGPSPLVSSYVRHPDYTELLLTIHLERQPHLRDRANGAKVTRLQ